MESMRLRDHDHVIEGFLGDPDEGLRRAAVGHLVALGREPTEFARRLLEGQDPALRRYLVDALADRPHVAGVLTPQWIDARLESGSREDLLLAARALGAMTGHVPAQKLRGLLANPDIDIRREALRSATLRPSPEFLDVLFELLPIPDLSYGAREALAAIGDEAVPRLQQLLDGKSGGHVQELAARTLARVAGPRAIAVLLTLVRSGDVRLRYLGLQGLARMRVRTGAQVLTRSGAHRLFLRELNEFRNSEGRYRTGAACCA
jgi:HEAT repeat protein